MKNTNYIAPRCTVFSYVLLFPLSEEGRGFYRVLVWRPEGKRPLGRPRIRWEYNIEVDLRDIGIDGANWIRLAQDRVQWWASVSTVMNLRVP
jgi:hypothetical protein